MARKQRSKGTGSLFRKTPTGPWIALYFDHKGDRREHSTRTTDRQTADRILTKLVAETALRVDLVIDPTADRFAIEGRVPLKDHVAAYVAHCERISLSAEHVASKQNHLKRLQEVAGITRLNEMNADALERYLTEIKAAGRSARSINFARTIIVTFGSWCVKTGRLAVNPLRVVPKQDETRDRRRVRRAMTDEEFSKLVTVAREHDRDAWYLAAGLAGLRKGDMCKLTWAAVDFTAATITIRDGKAKREDILPMHSQLADALRRRLEAHPALPKAKVWPNTPGNLTRAKDMLRAGIAREEVVLDTNGQPVIIGTGKNRRPKTRITTEDAEGRIIDLHALRTMLGTQLARAGVTPQVAQRIMRHSDYRTTLKSYTALGLNDTAKAIDMLPGVAIAAKNEQRATGTTDTAPSAGKALPNSTQLYCQQLERETVIFGDTPRQGTALVTTNSKNQKPRLSQGFLHDSSTNSAVERKRLELSTPSLQS